MRLMEARPRVVFIVEDLFNNQQLTVHDQRMVIHPVAKFCGGASDEIKSQAVYYNATYNLVDGIRRIRKLNSPFLVRVNWSGFEDDADMTREPVRSN